MSTPSGHDPHGHGHGPGDGHGYSDEIDFGKVIAVGVVSLVIFAIATYWAATILRRETAHVEEQSGRTKPATMVGQPEIGIVDQVPFVSDQRLDTWKRERAAFLDGYGWVDKDKGIAHIPIEKAMEQVAAGALPPGAPK